MTPREKFNKTVEELGLKISIVTFDKWVSSAIRDDGLHLWITGRGIQTAIIRDDRYSDHKLFGQLSGEEWHDTLRRAAQRELPQ